jgi:hypothetical protein
MSPENIPERKRLGEGAQASILAKVVVIYNDNI